MLRARGKDPEEYQTERHYWQPYQECMTKPQLQIFDQDLKSQGDDDSMDKVSNRNQTSLMAGRINQNSGDRYMGSRYLWTPESSSTCKRLDPRFVMPLVDNDKVRLHARVELKSRVEPRGDPSINVQWFKDGVPLAPNNRMLLYFNHGYAALIILGYESSDNGTYKCTAANMHGSDQVTATLCLDKLFEEVGRQDANRKREEKIKRLLKLKETMRRAERVQAEKRAEFSSRAERRAKSEQADRCDLEVNRQRGLLTIRGPGGSKEKCLSNEGYRTDQLARSRSQPPASSHPASSDSQAALHWRPYRELEDSVFLRKEREVYETEVEFEPTPSAVSDSVEGASKPVEHELHQPSARRLRGGDLKQQSGLEEQSNRETKCDITKPDDAKYGSEALLEQRYMSSDVCPIVPGQHNQSVSTFV